MIAWPGSLVRGGLLAATVATCLLTAPGAARAGDPRAEELSTQAGDLMFETPPKYDEAIDKYQQAIILSPEGKYYFNLCVAYYESGRYGLALQACDAVSVAGADDKVTKKTKQVLELVEKQLRGMGQDPAKLRAQIASTSTGGGGGDGSTGGGDGTGDGTTG
ncbi:MAG: hypothetical protein KC464_33010, partial [Myxococcales bacterium]|nr:hypothetical protein [Myxococcales bacterium]